MRAFRQATIYATALALTACAVAAARFARRRGARGDVAAPKYESASTRVLVLGAGFGGLETTLELDHRLRDNRDVAILMVARETTKTFTPLLWTLADGRSAPNHINVPLRALQKGRSFHVLNAEVAHIDLEQRVVQTSAGPRSFDVLVVALGSVTSLPNLPGVTEYAHVFHSPFDALQLRNHVIDAIERAHRCESPDERDALLTFVVIGGGDTGVELAALIEDFVQKALVKDYPSLLDHPARIEVLERAERVLPLADDVLARRATATLERSGVRLRAGVSVQEITAEGVRTSDAFIRAKTVFWAAGISAPDVVRALPGEHERNGAVLVDDHLRIPGHENVYVIGDAAWAKDGLSGRPVPALAQSAEREGRYVARAITTQLMGRPIEPFHFRKLGEMMLLGSGKAVAEIGPWIIDGYPAWLLWHLFYLAKVRHWRYRLLLAADWFLAALFGRETGELRLT